MKRTLHLLLCCILTAMHFATALAQEQKPSGLIDTLSREITADLRENILPFWKTHSVNPMGGFYGQLQYDGVPIPRAPKGGVLNARILWTFSAEYRLFADPKALELANRAQRYFIDHFFDKEYGGVYWYVSDGGFLTDSVKQAYAIAFGIYGLSEHYRATKNPESLQKAIELFNTLEEHLYDKTQGGYIESATRQWTTPKQYGYDGDGTHTKSMNTHLHVLEAYTNLYRVWPDPRLQKQTQALIELFLNQIIDHKRGHQNLFFTRDWKSIGKIDSYGHDIEMSWLLYEAAKVLNHNKLLKETAKVAVAIARVQATEGLHPKGGMMYEKKGEKLNSERSWWPQAEAVVGFLNAWELSGDPFFLEQASNTWQFIKTQMIDRTYGEWFSSVSATGNPAASAQKGSAWRCPYHNSRMGFEVYERFVKVAPKAQSANLSKTASDQTANGPTGIDRAIALPKGFLLNDQGYFENGAANVMVFQDIYPEGHQGGVGIIQHGRRIATNGDLRLEATPGQWQPLPKPGKRTVDREKGAISIEMSYPDPAQNMRGFNPLRYPDLELNYKVQVEPRGNAVYIRVDLDRPIPEAFAGQIGFNMELFPGWLFGRSWQMDGKWGIFPRQANGPSILDVNRVAQAVPLATGRELVVVPEENLQRLAIRSENGTLQLLDGRIQHNNGWFVVRQTVAAGQTEKAIEWLITPNTIAGWRADPVIHVSQVGYHPRQNKVAVIELDKNDKTRDSISLYRIEANGNHMRVRLARGTEWGRFLRYDNLQFDFSDVKQEGMYFIQYAKQRSQPFKIGANIYKREVWQPVLEYFLPVQMCHMRVSEKYRVWHDYCHMDDALMAPLNYNHIDGYVQGGSTLTSFKPGDHVPGLNIGGWHDAGDYDIRVESQAEECYILSLAHEAFGVNYDNTSIDQATRQVEIHQPDGKPDILQQIEHGVLSIVAGYNQLGRLYRGIIVPTVRQYVLLGDASAMTDGVVRGTRPADFYESVTLPNPYDDRMVFTEQNRSRELTVAQQLAATSRVLKGYNDTLAMRALAIAEEIYHQPEPQASGNQAQRPVDKTGAAIELLLTTQKSEYREYLQNNFITLINKFNNYGWMIGRVMPLYTDPEAILRLRSAVAGLAGSINSQAAETPYGVPYRPSIWGAGWDIQRFGMKHYFLVKAFPEYFPKEILYNALSFILGVHPGENTASFASGVGSRSATVAYGVNRADWSYIPGGVASGTALIRPDFAELLDFPFLWQQMEYVMGGGSSNYMFLVLAADQLLSNP